MAIMLRPETEKLIEERLRGGAYSSPDAIIYAALEALTDIESMSLDERTLDAIDVAEDQIDRGEYKDLADVRRSLLAKFTGK